MSKKTKKKAGKDATKQLNDMIQRKEKGKQLFGAKELVDTLPKQQVNYRKDRFIKLVEGNCYLRDTSYGIQILENKIGTPGKVIARIETQEDFDKAVKVIKENIKNYTPGMTKRELGPEDEVYIGIKYKTREQMKSIKQGGESYDQLINRLMEK